MIGRLRCYIRRKFGGRHRYVGGICKDCLRVKLNRKGKAELRRAA